MKLAIVCVALLATRAVADPVVAVMPLKDLSGGQASVGAAVRDTLTADLAGTPGVKVVERALVDKVFREQAAQPEGVLGRMIGATHLVLGSYQRGGDVLRVTARVVEVETGVVVGSAKVDGELDRMLELEDRLGLQLLHTMGWKGTPPRRTRPRLAARAIERFGDAALEPDVENKKALLKDAILASPQFSYAMDALAALEGRLGGYEQQQAAVLSEREQALLNAKKLPELFAMQKNARRYRALLSSCDATKGAERDYYRFVALDGLRRIDDALAAGEALLRDHPDSPHFAEVEARMRTIADVRRTEHARRADYDKDLAEKRAGAKGMELDFAPCIAARWNRQYNALMLDGCRAFLARQGSSTDAATMDHARAARLFVILALGELARFPEMREAVADFRKRYPDGDKEIDDKLAIWPTD